MLKHFIRIYFQCHSQAESEVYEIESRDIEIESISSDAYAYQFFDRTEVIIDGETLIGNEKNVSDIIYLGKKYTIRDIEENFNNSERIVTWMKKYQFHSVIFTKYGTWRFLKE